MVRLTEYASLAAVSGPLKPHQDARQAAGVQLSRAKRATTAAGDKPPENLAAKCKRELCPAAMSSAVGGGGHDDTGHPHQEAASQQCRLVFATRQLADRTPLEALAMFRGM